MGLVIVAAVAMVAGARSRGAEIGAPQERGMPPQGTYIGSDACKACHSQIAQTWDVAPHGKALSDTSLPQEARGCEGCHGPGSEHAGSMGRKPIGEVFARDEIEQVEQVCGKCHLSERNPEAPPGAPAFSVKHWRRTPHARQTVSCLNCHRIHGGASRSLQQPASELCLSCHEAVVARSGEYTHQPVAKGQCLLCHDPHGGQARHNLVDKVAAACLSCHAPGTSQFSAAHQGYPVENSDCLSCHDPHSFDRSASLLGRLQHQPFAARECKICHSTASGLQLAKPEKELCLTCHEAEKILPAAGPAGAPLTSHPPVDQGLCTRCHSPHAATRQHLMRDRTDYVCFFCHGGIEEASLSPYQHKPISTGDCTLCHQGHSSREKGLLKKESVALCGGCHATQGRFSHPVGVWKGRPVRDPNTKHLLTCARCHAVHGSAFTDLLPQEEDTLCRGCHRSL